MSHCAAATVKLLIAILLSAILASGVGLLGPAAVLAAPSTIAVLGGATAVESYGAVAVWSDYDAPSRSWHVVVRRDGRIATPPIPTL